MFAFNLNTNPKPVSQSDVLIEIDHLVRYIYRTITIPKLSLTKSKRQLLPVNDDLCLEVLSTIPKYLSVYDPQYVYNEYVDIFWQGCREVGILPNSQFYIPNHYFDDLGIERIYALVSWIADSLGQKTFRLKIKNRLDETKKNNQIIIANAHTLRQRCSKLLVIRVDFGYLSDRQHFIKIDDVIRHLESFTNKMSSQVFNHELGRSLVIEQAKDKGYHIHAVFFFNGHKVQRDWHKAQQIGDLWIKVAEGMGMYFNLHDAKAKRDYIENGKLGIGMILRKDDQAFSNLLVTLSYFANPKKDFQYLRMQLAGTQHFFSCIWEQKRKPRQAK